jgi:pimeloyl-ACP methyl ester carboxylesterase
MYRTRFKGGIVAEFLPPSRKTKRDRVVLLCDGMPSMPRKEGLARFLAGKGFWVVHPRYRGSWESDGRFLRKSPHLDILDILDELPKGLREAAFGKRFKLSPVRIFVMGGSFGAAAAILSTLDPRVAKAVANCPVVDWRVLSRSEKRETSNPSYTAYLREAFGNAYRLDPRDWRKLGKKGFYDPMSHAGRLDPSKILLFHAQDDPYVPWRSVARFARRTGARLKLFRKGGHLSTPRTLVRHWDLIEKFLRA